MTFEEKIRFIVQFGRVGVGKPNPEKWSTDAEVGLSRTFEAYDQHATGVISMILDNARLELRRLRERIAKDQAELSRLETEMQEMEKQLAASPWEKRL
jgi:predicted  nucleic acid-binding Zn-ribbon protein